ncbi:hypothetical protein F5B19DRAFT_444065 [Rostrohypoxylon terebratum]|nr:hypothetical protein F5B19DRAFT_444065 [Rostrohypoxylon terebratum]
MAEIPNSDSPDLLSSSPPRPNLLLAPSSPSTISIPSTNSDFRSSTSESSNRQTPVHRHQSQISQNSSPSPAVTTPMSHNREASAGIGDLLNLIGAGDDLEHYFDRRALEDEESLFVSDGEDLDYNEDEYYREDLNNLTADREILEQQPWVEIPSDDSFDEDPFLGRMFRQRNAGNNLGQLDELVEMEVAPAENPRRNQGHQQRQPRAQPEVIDLTGDNDSPSQPSQPAPPNHSQNTRRQQSQQRNILPRLARSDASYMEPRNVINLISDSDDEEPVVMPPLRRNSHRSRPRPAAQEPPRNRQPPDHAQPSPPPFNIPPNPSPTFRNLFNQLPMGMGPLFRIINGGAAANRDHNRDRDEEDIVIMGHRHLTPNVIPPQPNNFPINLDVRVHPFAIGINPPHAPGGLGNKPAHEPPKETRDGFTRNTGEDVVAICPSCEFELAYDPDDNDNNGPPAKKARTKKDKAEHHFWAVKACGHVYCRSCYENRKPVGKNHVHVGFRPDPNGPKNHVLCAVEDCKTDVSAKSAWVGIFM